MRKKPMVFVYLNGDYIRCNLIIVMIALTFIAHAEDTGCPWRTEWECWGKEIGGWEYWGTEGLDFELINNNTAYRVSYFTSVTYGTVRIPGYYNGKPVTEIGDGAFSGGFVGATIGCYALTVTNISIPSSVTIIGDGAFSGCMDIADISIPASVTRIGDRAFAGWTAAQTIYIQGHASRVAADRAWGRGWRAGCNAAIVYQGRNRERTIRIIRN